MRRLWLPTVLVLACLFGGTACAVLGGSSESPTQAELEEQHAADCQDARLAQARARALGLDGIEGSPEAVLVRSDLTQCHFGPVLAVLEAIEQLEHVDLADAVSVDGGARHHITQETPGFEVGDGGELCLWYERRKKRLVTESLTPCTDQPRFSVSVDLATGLVSGRVELDLYCPGGPYCRPDEVSEGTVRGTFGPFLITLQPEDPPPDFPFPAHHYFPNTFGWSAAGPTDLALTAVGSYPGRDGDVLVDARATERGWVVVDLMPLDAYGPDQNPTRWLVDVGILLDYGDDRDPHWDLYAGFRIEIEEDGISPPPRG